MHPGKRWFCLSFRVAILEEVVCWRPLFMNRKFALLVQQPGQTKGQKSE
jgi:hypothetical protein